MTSILNKLQRIRAVVLRKNWCFALMAPCILLALGPRRQELSSGVRITKGIITVRQSASQPCPSVPRTQPAGE